MNYDIEDMERIIGNNIANHVVKQYMINKNDIDTYYTLGEIIENEKLNTEKKLIERAEELSNRLGIKITVDELKTSLRFYTYINNGMIKSYNIKLDEYLKLMNLNDLDEINKKISCNNNDKI